MRASIPVRPLVLLVACALAFAPPAARAGREPVAAKKGMVTSTRELASRAGADVLARGGNAIDAAIAVSFALAVTWPSAGNLGGGGFMLIRRADGKAEVIDYRERAPLAATETMYLDDKGRPIPGASTLGWRAVGVPGTVAGLALAHERHGRLAWAKLVEPARRLASEGFALDWHAVLSLQRVADDLAKFPDSKRIFLKDGRRYEVGDRLVQRELAETLSRVAKDPRDFYAGETARRLVAGMKKNGGLVTAEDLRTYEPTVREPLRGRYRGHDILTMPPPSSGGAILLEMLGVLERFPIAALGPDHSETLHLLVETMRRAFADRARYLGDTDFVRGVPIAGLVDPAYAARRAETIRRDYATPSAQVSAGDPPGAEAMETTHFNVVDAEGNAVSNTTTLNGSFGSKVTAPGTGVLLNNEMDDFTTQPGAPNVYGLVQSKANAIAPRKRPLSSMTPTIVVRDGRLQMALGSPGGPTIINTVLQVLINVIDLRMNVQQAVDHPRIHHQWLPDRILWEPFGLARDTRVAMEQRGHQFVPEPMPLGDANAILVGEKGTPGEGLLFGATDPRMGGVAVGY